MYSFVIALDNPLRVYFPGSPVSGALQIVLEKELKANAVFIELRGEAHTHFTDEEERSRTVDG